jgi:phosphate transport system protein
MERHFHEELSGLKRTMAGMGELAERMIVEAVALLVRKDQSVLASLELEEAEVDRLQREVDEACAQLIARHQPAASDLRFILGCVRANVEIERMADMAINLSHKARRLLEAPELCRLEEIERMAEIAARMGRDGIESYLGGDVGLARDVIARDARLNALKATATARIAAAMAADPAVIPRALDVAMAARNLERMGDHAKNIAEQAIYVVEGRDVRHLAKAPERLT